MQALFYMDMRHQVSEETLDLYCRSFPPPQKAGPFFFTIVKGVMHCWPEIDKIIERYSKNWKISRMSCVDRNIMRVAVYELFFCPDIPPKVSINEAIDIGKKFGTEESGSFINGILDGIRKALDQKDIHFEIDTATDTLTLGKGQETK